MDLIAHPWLALKTGIVTLAVLALLLMVGASHSPVQAHAALRHDQLVSLKSAAIHRSNDFPTISRVSVSFFTHNDNKDFDTSVSVFVQNKVGIFTTQDLARLENFAGNDEFGDNPPSTHAFDLFLASDMLQFDPMRSLPIFAITVAPNGHDRWIFDVTITITTSDGAQYSGRANGIVLDQDNRIYNGVFGR